LEVGGVQRTNAQVSPAVAAPIVGASVTVLGVTARVVRAEKAPSPTALTAATLNLTAVPFTSPLTIRLVASAAAVAGIPIGLSVVASNA
jgi:hypothetical protein